MKDLDEATRLDGTNATYYAARSRAYAAMGETARAAIDQGLSAAYQAADEARANALPETKLASESPLP